MCTLLTKTRSRDELVLVEKYESKDYKVTNHSHSSLFM